VFNVDYTRRQPTSAASGGGQGRCVSGMSTIRQLNVTEGYALAMQHFNAAAESLVVYTTSAGGIHGWDLRAPREAWLSHSRASDGLPQSLCVAPNRLWMCTGTSRGFFNCWDLRFQVLAHSWRHPAGLGITKLINHPQPPAGQPWVIAATEHGAEVSTWDVQSGSCPAIFRAQPEPGMNSIYPSVAAAQPATAHDYGLNDLRAVSPTAAYSMQALHAPIGTASVLTAGSDQKIRFWNTATPQESFTVFGGDSETGYHDSIWENGDCPMYNDALVTQEVGSQHISSGMMGNAKDVSSRSWSPSPHHKDTILDVHAAEMSHQKAPTRVIISASRDGTIKVTK